MYKLFNQQFVYAQKIYTFKSAVAPVVCIFIVLILRFLSRIFVCTYARVYISAYSHIHILNRLLTSHVHISFGHSHNECSTHAHQQPPSYQSSAKQSNSKRINTSESVEYALSKGTATEIGTSNNNNNHSVSTSFEESADRDAKNMSASSQNRRDRLGLWGTDSEIAASVSGLDRLRLARYNKVRRKNSILYEDLEHRHTHVKCESTSVLCFDMVTVFSTSKLGKKFNRSFYEMVNTMEFRALTINET